MGLMEIISKALRYPWNHRSIWFYGVLLAVISAISSATTIYDKQTSDFLATNFNFKINVAEYYSWLIPAIAILFVVLVAGVFISSWSLAAIVTGVSLREAGKSINRKKIGELAKKHIKSLVFYNLLIPFVVFAIFFILVIVIMILLSLLSRDVATTLGLFILIAAILFLVPALIYVSIIWPLGNREIILSSKSPIKAIYGAVELVRGNFLNTWLFAILTGFIRFIGGWIILIPLFLFFAAFIILLLQKIFLWAGILVIILSALAGLYLLAVGFLQGFVQTGWTLWWMELKKQKETNE